MPVEIGVHTWLEPVFPEPEVKIPELVAQGVTAIEDGYPFFVTYPVRTVEQNCRLLSEAKIKLWSVHAPFGDEFSLCHSDKAVRCSAVEYHKFVLARAALGGAPVVVIHPGNGVQPDRSEEAVPLLLDSLDELLPVAQQLRIRLALENLPFHCLGSDARALRRVVDTMDSEWLGVCFDTGHAHVAGGLMQSMEILKDKIITFHLADNDGTRDLHLQPGHGSIPWDDFLGLFSTMDFRDPVVVEARPWGGDGYAQQIKEVTALLAGRLLTLNVNQRTVKAHC
ncbi:MAG: sugar phosphate isomerase/epimerase, partial [Planctomycetaceae bacterium]